MPKQAIQESITETLDSLNYKLLCKNCGLSIAVSVIITKGEDEKYSAHDCITGCLSLNRVRDRAYALIQGLAPVRAENEVTCENLRPSRDEMLAEARETAPQPRRRP